MLQLNTGDYIAGKCGTANGINCMLIVQQRFPTFPTNIEEVPFVSTNIFPLGTSASTLYTVDNYVFIKSIILTNVTGSDIGGISLYLNGTSTANKFLSEVTLKANTVLHFDTNGISQYPLPVTVISGGGGGGTGASYIFGEIPSGTIDGINTTFTISNTPLGLSLFLNGQRLTEGDDYTLSGSTLTMIQIPQPTDTFVSDYTY